MKIHKEGFATILIVLLLCILLFWGFSSICTNQIVIVIFGIILIGFWGFIISFFRVPKRQFTYNANAIVAPADGKIVVIEEVFEKEVLQTKCKQISIFMSPLNVHVNRYPINGTVTFSKHHDGLKLPAFNPKSSDENERTTIVLKTENGYSILFRQIAGAVARRIVNYAKIDDIAKQNNEFGFIKFGSRVDIFIPLEMKVKVELNQIVRGGQTILAIE